MAKSTPSPKLGLALSGGGFRASFYHIGVLAQLAEQGLARQVEVISTVSGGSIVGALYYLHVKELLETKPDADITDQDYIDIVKAIEADFLEATEKNIRTATYADFIANFKMVYLNYSRSDRIAELYEAWLYQEMIRKQAGRQRKFSKPLGNPIQMRELKIYPPDGPADFKPKLHNAGRKAKVPVLVLNATTLNTGRGWEFTAQSMGEPPPLVDLEVIDKKPIRLLWADSYDDMVPHQQDFPLAHAVAASACVPALFDPMAVSGLYQDGERNEAIRVQLVDGGVFDNQGIEGLLSNGCNCFVVSDAAGQMGTENDPGVGEPVVLGRVSSVLQDRSRTKGLMLLFRTQGKNVAFVNLRQGLGVRTIHWIDKDGKQAADAITDPTSQDFGVDPAVQDSLSKLRTDLDAFTEVEAYSLMLSGYRMSESSLLKFKSDSGFPAIKDAAAVAGDSGWKFLDVAKWAKQPSPDYLKQLKAGQATFGKALLLIPWLWIPLLAAVAGLLWLLWPQLLALLGSSIPVSLILIGLGLWLLNSLAPKLLKLMPFLEVLRPQAGMARSALKVVYLAFGTVLLWLYIKLINPLFLARGRVSRLS